MNKKRGEIKDLYVLVLDSSSEDGLLAPLLGQDGSGFVLSIRVVGQFWGAGGDRALQDGLLQVIKHRRVLLSEEGHGHATLTRTTSTTDTMDVVWRGDGRSNKMNACLQKCTITRRRVERNKASDLRCSSPCRS